MKELFKLKNLLLVIFSILIIVIIGALINAYVAEDDSSTSESSDIKGVEEQSTNDAEPENTTYPVEDTNLESTNFNLEVFGNETPNGKEE